MKEILSDSEQLREAVLAVEHENDVVRLTLRDSVNVKVRVADSTDVREPVELGDKLCPLGEQVKVGVMLVKVMKVGVSEVVQVVERDKEKDSVSFTEGVRLAVLESVVLSCGVWLPVCVCD